MKEKSGYAWWIFASCCLISLIAFGLVLNTTGLFFEPMSVAFHVGRAQIALMSTVQSIASAVTLVFAGKIMSKVSIRWLLTGCFLLMGIGLLCFSFAQSLMQFYMVSVLLGICTPFAVGLSIPVLLGNWFEKKLGTVMGFALGISAIGGTVFNPMISSVITNLGWRSGWFTEAAIVLITLVPVAVFIIRDKPKDGQVAFGHDSMETRPTDSVAKDGIELREAVKTPMFYLVAFGMLALAYINGFIQHISGHVINVGMPLTIGATVVSGVMIGAAVGKVGIGYLLDRFNNGIVITLFAVFGVVGWSGLLTMRTAPLLIASGLIIGLGQSILLVGMPYTIRREFGQKDYSNILSVTGVFQSISGAAAIGINGAFLDLTGSFFTPLLLNVILFALAGFAIVLSIKLSGRAAHKVGDVQRVQ